MFGARLFSLCAIGLSVAFCTSTAQADFIDVLVLDYDTTDAGFATGGRYEHAYEFMSDSNHFGPGQTVNRTFNFLPKVSSLDNVSLGTVGLIIVGHKHLSSLTWDDALAIHDHVYYNGASVLALGHSFSDISGTVAGDYSGFPSLSTWMASRHVNNGISSPPPYRYPDNSNMVVQNVGAGPASGAFGNVSGEIVTSTMNAYWDGSNANSSGTFAIQYQDGFTYDDGLFNDYGAGRYVFLGSVDMIEGSDTLAGRFNEARNRDFFGNTIEYLSEHTIVNPEPSSLALTGMAGCVAMLHQYRRKKRRQ